MSYSFLEFKYLRALKIHFKIKYSAKKQRFDLTEAIFSLKAIKLEHDLREVETSFQCSLMFYLKMYFF